MAKLTDKLKKLPTKPGVYFFKDKTGKIIYIGKSVNLKNRVRSYFQNKNLGIFTLKMVKEISNIDIQVCDSEFEALILESKLINLHQPKYNIQYRDDKSFLMIVITDEDYPRIFSTRKKDKKGTYFGPFPSANEVRRVLKTIRRIFPFCTCKPRKKGIKRPCLYYHLGLCPGCCIGIDKNEYKKTISKIKKILRGNIKGLIRQLDKEMKQASKVKDYEKAGQIKKQIDAINFVILNWQNIDENSLNFNLDFDKTKSVLIEAKKIFPQLLSLHRIEAYDISNLYGENATGSMVVFKNLLPTNNQYRRFKIRIKDTPDDTAMMEEVMQRRLKHKEWSYPELIVVDGGKGQVSAVFSVLRNEKMDKKIFVLGLAKKEEIIIKPEIKERLIIGWQEIKLSQDSLLLRLLQNIRNESHRFAKKYHLWLRKRKYIK